MRPLQRCTLDILSICSLAIVFSACVLSRVDRAPSPGITVEEVSLLHPIGRYIYQQKELSAEQANWIRRRFGERYYPAGGKVEYVYVQSDRNRGPHPQAYVFKVRGESSHGRFTLLVCQSGGKINELYLLEGTMAGGGALDPSFLDQFAAMKVVDSSGPDRPQPLPGRDDLSRDVAEAIRAVLIQAVALGL